MIAMGAATTAAGIAAGNVMITGAPLGGRMTAVMRATPPDGRQRTGCHAMSAMIGGLAGHLRGGVTLKLNLDLLASLSKVLCLHSSKPLCYYPQFVSSRLVHGALIDGAGPACQQAA